MARLVLLLFFWLFGMTARAASTYEFASFQGGVVLGDPADVATVVYLAAHADEALPRLAGELGVRQPTGLRVTVAPSELAFRDLQPGRPPAWADGTAWPNQGLIFLKSPRIRPGTATPLSTVLEHELVHVLLGQAFGDRPVPAWLQEGVAKVLAREVTPDMSDALAGAVLGGSLLSLDELTDGFPADPMRARLAYAQSADLIAYLRNHHGEEALPVLVRRMAAGADVDEAMRAATGLSPLALDAAWRARLLASPIWLRALVRPELWLGLAGLFFLVGGAFKLRRNRARLARWEEREAMEDALLQALAARGALVPSSAGGPYAPDLVFGASDVVGAPLYGYALHRHLKDPPVN